MDSIFLVVSIVGATAAIFVVHFIIYIIRKWVKARRLKQNGIEATARIMEARVINEAGRYLPFVRLKLQVNAGEQNSFITEADSLFSVDEIQELIPGNSIRLRYNAADITQAQIIKATSSFNKKGESRRQPVIDSAKLFFTP